MLLCSKLVSASFIMQQKQLDTKMLWNHLRNNWKTKGYTPGGGGYSHTLPIWACAAQRGGDFEAPDLEWGIHFRGVFQNGV